MSTDMHSPADSPGFTERVLELLRRGEAEDIVRMMRVGGDLTGVVGDSRLALPPVRLAHTFAPGGTIWPVTTTKADFPSQGDTVIVTLPEALPHRDGYVRQYRLAAYVTVMNMTSVTGYRCQLWLQPWDVEMINHYEGVNMSARTFTITGGWMPVAGLDTVPAPSGTWLQGELNWAGAEPTMYFRGHVLEGRYVPV